MSLNPSYLLEKLVMAAYSSYPYINLENHIHLPIKLWLIVRRWHISGFDGDLWWKHLLRSKLVTILLLIIMKLLGSWTPSYDLLWTLISCLLYLQLLLLYKTANCLVTCLLSRIYFLITSIMMFVSGLSDILWVHRAPKVLIGAVHSINPSCQPHGYVN